ncbi:MAG: sarcosine oxidase subunit alpha [Lysobacterales bacterium]|jgi:sarcosine oxidase subunit alpha
MGDSQANRLEQGGRIDRSKPISFRFNGKSLCGYEGDTLASALLANQVSIVGRSFKLHRPRGIFASGAEEPNAIMQIGKGASTLPNLKATQVELYDGLEAWSTKGWPSVNFDVAEVIDVASRVFSAGFYYKTFMFPGSWWEAYERIIRRSAGFGRAPASPDPDFYEHRNAHCDVLVVGAGPAGLMAALLAAKSGARVIIADEQSEFGGQLLSSKESIDALPPGEWLENTVNALSEMDNVTRLNRSSVFGYFDQNFLTIAQSCTDHLGPVPGGNVRQRLWRVRARQVVLAQGAFERPLVFCNNDRPGVMLASAVSTYLNRYAVCPGRSAVVFTNNDSAYQAALDLHAAGCVVHAIVDSRPTAAASLGDEAEAAGIQVLAGHVVTDVSGRKKVSGVKIAKWSGDSSATVQAVINISCDLLAVSGGWSPAVHLHSQAGGKNVWDDSLHCFVPGETAQANFSAGACKGQWTLEACLKEGIDAGSAAAQACGFQTTEIPRPKCRPIQSNPLQPLWRVPAEKDPDRCAKQFVDFQTDASVSDIRLAVREGYRNVEHVKRYTAMGFGTDQGKLGNINGMAVVAECLDLSIPEVGTTTFRPAYTPVTFGMCAGESVGALFEPVRKTAIQPWHEEAGAKFENVGQWIRPWYFPQQGEDLRSAVARECLATRRSVGIMDASTLGKIDVRGPDSVRFLERIYTHDVAAMKPGRCAYGIMLGEDGMLKDDGVMARLGEQHFYLTTTTGGAAAVMSWLEIWLQTEWPDLEVYLTSLTDHYSTIAVAGPNSRKVVQKLGCNIDLESSAFPFMSVKNCQIAGIPAQIFRVSFSGELAFELNVDSSHAHHLWTTLIEAGNEYDITPYGTETMHVLRAEKGFVIVGQDTDGSVSPLDLGMNWLLSKNKDFIGKRSLARPDSSRKDRKQLVGLLSSDNKTVLPEGTQLIDDPTAAKPVPMCGHVSSSYFSETLGHPIAMALVASGRVRKGETVFAALADGSSLPVKLVSPAFYDPKSERQND